MKNRIMKSFAWGVSTMVGFIIADRLFKAGMKIADKQEVIDAEEVVVEEEPE